MKFYIITIFLSLFLFFSNFLQTFAQTQNLDEEEFFFPIEQNAVFEGGMDNFYEIVNNQMRFSETMKEGRVFIEFAIDTTGKMIDLKIAKIKAGKGLSEENGKEALRIMNLISEHYDWKPAEQRGKKVKIRMHIPIVFKEENTIAKNCEKFKITVTEDIPIKKDLFTKDRDTSKIMMNACFYQGVQIEYIEIERDTNNQEYLIYNMVENPPIFEGGIDNFYKIVGKNLKIAENQSEIGSRVFIEFVIDTVGKMTDFKILKSNFSEKNNTGFLQTLDFINENYTWKPAIHKEKKVFYRMNLPIIIHLSK